MPPNSESAHRRVNHADYTVPRLAVELYALIIRMAAPVYTPPIRDFEANRSRYVTYRSERHAFCSLALVSHTWYNLVQPELFRVLLIFARSASNLLLVSALERHATHVRTIVFEAQQGALFDSVFYHELERRAMVDVAVRRCFVLATRLEALEVYGCQFLWQIRGRGSTIKDAIPTPGTAPFRSLTWECFSPLVQQDGCFCLALAHAGERLERLKLFHWRLRSWGCVFPPLNLLGVHPRLTHLSLLCGEPTVEEVNHLVSRTLSGIGTVQEVAIEHLSLRGMTTLDIPAILEILNSHSLGRHLTSLKIRLAPDLEYQTSECLGPSSILNLCPGLTLFSYLSPVSDDVFPHLPHTLQVLELLISGQAGSEITPSPDGIFTYICSPRARHLRTLRAALSRKWHMARREAVLMPIALECKRRKIIFEHEELPELDYYRNPENRFEVPPEDS